MVQYYRKKSNGLSFSHKTTRDYDMVGKIIKFYIHYLYSEFYFICTLLYITGPLLYVLLVILRILIILLISIVIIIIIAFADSRSSLATFRMGESVLNFI